MNNKTKKKTLYNTPTEREKNTADKGVYKSKRVVSISADQVGGGKGRRYYIGEGSSGRRNMARMKAGMDANYKMAFTPQDSIPKANIDMFFADKKKKKKFKIFRKKK